MPPAPGRSFGPYEILSPLGAGGMGEVFRARDTRLDRLVALKVSRAEFSDRFRQEARAIAALNHPHIATLYDVGPDYLVMEFVEGETLPVPLPLPRAIHFARQILGALEAAHRKGIVHRDLKPANIMVAKNGIKLLDFGLAKMKSAVAAADETVAMTISMEGAITGTLQYMSPEQLEAKPATERSDIFAFGAVLYEMLTGQKAFRGESAASVISAIMSAEPSAPCDLQPGISPALDRILRRCLAKDPDERWQSAADIRHALDLVDAAPAVASAVEHRRTRPWLPALTFLAGLLIAAAAFRFIRPAPPEPPTYRPLTYSGRTYYPSLSPDGKQVAFVWTAVSDRAQLADPPGLYLQLLGGGNPLRLKDVLPDGKTAWSPDSSRIAFVHKNALYVVPALGGSARRIASFSEGGDPGVAWAAGGAFFITAADRGLVAIPADGGEPRPITTSGPAIDHCPAISPDSRTVAFVRHTSTYNSQLFLVPLASDGKAAAKPQQLTNGVWDIRSVDWSADGAELIFQGSPGSNNPTLWRIPRSGGTAVRINVPALVAGQPSVSGRDLAFISSEDENKIFRVSLAGSAESPRPLLEGIGLYSDLSVSSDGSRIAFASNRTGSKEIWTANADGSNQTQLTSFNGPAVGSPRWSPDGKSIVFDGYAGGSSDIYLVSADGGKPSRLTSDPANEVRPSWSHDGNWVYYGSDRGGSQQIWKIPAAGGAPVQVTHDGGYNAFETPDGQWLYLINGGKLQRMRPDGSGLTTIGGGGISANLWTIGAHHIFVFDGSTGTLWKLPFANEIPPAKAFQFTAPNQPESGGAAFAVPSDESYVIFRRTTRSTTTLLLIDGFR